MKIWLWLILLGAGGAATYLIVSDVGSPSKTTSAPSKVEITEELQEDKDEPSQPSLSGTPTTETILPADGGLKSATKEAGPLGDKLTPPSVAENDHERKDRENEADDLDAERQLLMESPRDLPKPTRRFKSRTPEVTASAPPSAPVAPVSLNTGTATNSASSNATNTGPSAGGISGASLGGSFPALPTPASSPSSGSSFGSSSGSSSSPSGGGSSGQVFSSPSTPSSAGNAKPVAGKPASEAPTPAASDGPNNVAAKEIRSDKPTDELIKPLNAETQRGPNDPDSVNNAWLEAMKIPSGFTGLSLTPKAVPAVPVAAANQEPEFKTEPVSIQGATWKSALDAADRPSLQILKECPSDPAGGECTSQQVPAGGPVVVDYLFNGAAHQEDLIPDSKESFEIGTVAVGTQTECAFRIHPGNFPGKYLVLLTGKTTKLLGSFEVVAAASGPTAEAASVPHSNIKAIPQNKAAEPR